MTLLKEHTEAGWREVAHLGPRFAAERIFARPGATSSVIRVEADSQKLLRDAVALRESQLVGADAEVADVITNDGTLVTGSQHEALRVEGVTVKDAEQVVEPVANEDAAAAEAGVDKSEAVESPPAVASDSLDQARVLADAALSEAPESPSTPSGDVTPAASWGTRVPDKKK